MEFWKNVLRCNKTNPELFGPMDQQYVWCKKKKKYKAYEQSSLVIGYFADSGQQDCMKHGRFIISGLFDKNCDACAQNEAW